jgi:diacylglycerol O-acyltransferase
MPDPSRDHRRHVGDRARHCEPIRDAGEEALPPIHALDLDVARKPPRLLSERLAAFGGGVLRQANAATEVYRRVFAESAAALTAGRGPASNLFSAPHIVTNAPFGIERSVAMFSLPLVAFDLSARRRRTLNDVVMAIVDEALVATLRPCETPAKRLVAGCPVSTREKGDTRAGTDATMIFVPLGEPDAAPGERLAQIVVNTRAAKANVRSLSKEAARNYALLAFGLSEGIGAAGLRARVAPLVNLAVSNVPGPRVPLYLGQARLESLFPISMLASGVGLNVTLVSTAEEMHFGVIAGAALMPDVQKLERLCVKALAPLEEEAVRRPGAGTAKRAGTANRAGRLSSVRRS